MNNDYELFIQLWLALSLIIVSISLMFDGEFKQYKLWFGVFGLLTGGGGIIYSAINLGVL